MGKDLEFKSVHPTFSNKQSEVCENRIPLSKKVQHVLLSSEKGASFPRSRLLASVEFINKASMCEKGACILKNSYN